MPDSPPSPPLPNEPAARTPDGTLKDATTLTALTDPSTTPSPPNPEPTNVEPTATTPTPPKPGEPPVAIPDKYEFRPAEGAPPYDETIIATATPVFKELGLSQAQADKLVSIWNTHAKSQADIAVQAVIAQGEKWMTETKADPSVGPKLDTIKADIGRAFDAMIADNTLTRKDVEDFKQTMDLSMAGNQRAFIKTLGALAKSRIEGKPINPGRATPSEAGQNPNGAVSKPTPAQLMYPNLASSSH